MLETVLATGCVLFGGTTAALAGRELGRYRRRWPRSPIPGRRIEQWDPRFHLDSFDKIRSSPVLFTSKHGSGRLSAPSDLETFILAVLSRDARRLFEFGTCTGRTAYLWSLNSPADAEITTLTLPPDQLDMQLSSEMHDQEIRQAEKESQHQDFVYSGTPQESKIRQLLQDSATLDVAPYRRRMDLIFVDGGHSYPYVKSDSQMALDMVAPGGIIVWHDYHTVGHPHTRGVYRYLNELSRTHALTRIQDTSLVAYRAA